MWGIPIAVWEGWHVVSTEGTAFVTNPYAKDKDQVPDLTCWASYMVGHRWNRFETIHDLDRQRREHPATACQLLYGWLLLEFLRPFDVGWPKKLRALD